MFNAINNFFSDGYKKYIDVNGENYEVRISDYTCGCRGWFDVKVWKNKKTFLTQPIIEFNTFDDPLNVAEQQIIIYREKEEKYFSILKKLEEQS